MIERKLEGLKDLPPDQRLMVLNALREAQISLVQIYKSATSVMKLHEDAHVETLNRIDEAIHRARSEQNPNVSEL